ncbi:MAG: AAA family ATPase [Planctomycetaceae bacterium]|nr:AAA family ATPase [Planctomycetaceae bacterium]
MRFQRLHIPAFGPFTNLDLSFPSTAHDLHVFYGENEAGKSSLLRAIRDLLFGIHGQSSDNFLHEYKRLRLHGEIENQAGERLVFQRRKGNKNTLLDHNGTALQDSALRPFLGSVDLAYFSTMFGLGASELREGAAQLLKGEGEIGNALFSASLGGTPIQRVLDSLVADSERLFKGRATANVAIRPAVNRYKELLKKSRDATVNAETWDQLERDLAEQSKAKNTLVEEIDRISREIAWIDRCEDALPSVGRLNDEMKLLSELPALPEVASDFVERAKAARSSVGESCGRVQALKERISQLEIQLENCATAPEVLANADALDLLHQELGAYREQKKTLSKLKQELAGIEPNLLAGMKDLGVSGGFETLETVRLSSALQLSIEEAANALLSALSNQSAHSTKSEELKKDIEHDESELALLPETDLTQLREALADAAEAADANKTLAVSQMAVEKLLRDIATERSLVPGVPEDLDVASRLSVPAPATIRKFRERFASLDRDIESARTLISEANETIGTLENELQRLERRGELPSEESLKQAREHRDHGWQLVLAEWKGDGAKEELDQGSPLEEAFPHSIIKADNIADQLRMDAESVAQAEEKRLQIKNCQKRIADANVTLASLHRETEECRTAWESEWAPIGVVARSPEEMLEWRENWVGLRETISKLRDAESEVRSKKAKVEKATSTLATALMESGDKPYSVLFEAARSRVQKGEESTGQRNAIGKRVEKLKGELASLERRASGLFPAVQTAEANWKLRCRSAGFSEDTTPEAGLRLLQERKELLAKFDSWNKLSSEAQNTVASIQGYEQSVSAHAKSHGIEADVTESQEAGLWKALSDARSEQAKHDQLTSQIVEAKSELSDAESTLMNVMEELQELMRVSKLQASEELEPLIANLEKHKSIQDRIDRCRESLTGLARGQGLDDFIVRVQSENADDLPQRKAHLEASKETMNANLQEVQSLLEGLNRQKKELEKAGDAAADFRQQAESVAATLRQDASRYIRLRLAAHFLRNQIEQFREENQGPLLERSGQVFKQMTRDAFDGLAAEFNDEDIPVIVGRRENGANVPVDGMSDGSRDQLYLALRLAAMERYLEEHEPMPLILDDLLITFDNERTKAIIPQLVNLSKRTQVFLFTHHEHLVDICHETVGKDRFTLHRLGTNSNSVS